MSSLKRANRASWLDSLCPSKVITSPRSRPSGQATAGVSPYVPAHPLRRRPLPRSAHHPPDRPSSNDEFRRRRRGAGRHDLPRRGRSSRAEPPERAGRAQRECVLSLPEMDRPVYQLDVCGQYSRLAVSPFPTLYALFSNSWVQVERTVSCKNSYPSSAFQSK